MQLNRTINLAEKAAGAVFIKAVQVPGATMRSQNMWVYPGQVLIACCQKSQKLRNGVRYTVMRISGEGDEVELDNGAVLSTTDAAKYLRLSHAQTFASCQGDEFESVRLWDCDSRNFTWKHLYVGLSRAKGSAEVAF